LIPQIDIVSGSSSITGVISINYKPREIKKCFNFISNEGAKINANEYIISSVEKGSGVYNLEREETVEGGL